MDCTLEMRQWGWPHFAGEGLQSEAETILTEVSADGRRAPEDLQRYQRVGARAGEDSTMPLQVAR